MLTVIDYGMGNLRSFSNIFEKWKTPFLISGNPDDIAKAEKLILPGVGHFAEGMRHLHESGLVPILEERVIRQRIPILGICLGMQLLTKSSEEGNVPGLAWLPAKTIRFEFSQLSKKERVPHVGFNKVQFRDSPISSVVSSSEYYYFTHSYHVVCETDEIVLGRSEYGFSFTSAVRSGNIFGTQFHPEKSHQSGLQLLRNYVEMKSC